MNQRQFSYSHSPAFPSLQKGLPFLPLTLSNTTHSIKVSGLVDSGSTVNVLPYDIGIQLGLIWETQTFSLPPLVGILRNFQAFGVLVTGQIEPFAPVHLAFAWTQSNDVPVILGQMNFFSEFDVCFFGSQEVFNIVPKPPKPLAG
ncbi:hypothetical protein [Candidatus Parabeggiatoa sp. HSG14]|uniref:hypothetical protein n=1 Tax=Candidatus Parabeggiatoa sp. HSG14 TaxID=3055593 RepID=UPI0025A8421F|nr:hypothetical protein [Thiotrichales bacterium HSG14]